jgi:hypothetical protein
MAQTYRAQFSGKDFQKASGDITHHQTHAGIFHLQSRAFFHIKPILIFFAFSGIGVTEIC